MKKRNYILQPGKWLEIFLSVLIYSCNAPRNNPLDPNNPGTFALIQGNVSTSYSPIKAIPDAVVYWEPGNKFVKTDQEGNFLIGNIAPDDGRLIFQKEGFRTDTVFVFWNGSRKITRQVHLISQPVLDYLNITSWVKYEESGKSSELHISAKIGDKDSQIDSAYIENTLIGLKKKMDFTGDEYSLILNQDEVQTDNLESLIGEDFNLLVFDSSLGFTYRIGGERMSRVINYEPEAVYPRNSDTITSPPVLQWNPVVLDYSFNYMVEISTNETDNNQVVYTSSLLDPATTTLNTEYSLSPGKYLWRVWIIDQFDNRAKSRPAIFVIQ